MARKTSITRRVRDTEPYDFALPLYLLLCLLLGGASAAGALANALLQFVGLAIIVWHALNPSLRALSSPGRALGVLILVYLGWLLLTLVPLPASLWSVAGGRQFLVDSFAVLGLAAPVRPLTLDPDRTIASALSILPFLAVLTLTLASSDRARETALLVVIAVAALSILIGAMQLLGGGDSMWYFYRITNRGSAVGFFANSNHLATFFLMALAFTAALAARARNAGSRSRKASRHWPLIGVFILVMCGLVLNGSVAGLLLAVPCTFGCALLYLRGIGRPLPMRPALAGVAILAALVLVLAIGPMRQVLFDNALTAGASTAKREVSMALTTKAAGDFLPFGSGLGTFRWLYTRYEDASTVTIEYTNHTHNDYLEFALELGLIGIGLMIVSLAWIGARARAVWAGTDPEGSIARASAIALAMVLAHSIVDYPARTAAIAAMVALSIGILRAPQPRRGRKAADDGVIEEKAAPERARHLSA